MYAERDKQLTFYDEPIYAQTVPQDHFLRKLNIVVDFSFVNELCKDLYCPDNGRPSWEPQLLFKALFLQFLYNLNDYTVEDEINDRMSFKYFLGLPVNEKGPDHSTLFKFRDRLGNERFSQIFNKIVELARAHKLVSNKLYIVDSTDVKAKVDMFRVTEEIRNQRTKTATILIRMPAVDSPHRIQMPSSGVNQRTRSSMGIKSIYVWMLKAKSL